MYRRAFLTTATIAVVAGCNSGGEANTPIDTEPPATERTRTPAPTATPTQEQGQTTPSMSAGEARSEASSPSYDQLFRNIESYEGDPVHFELAQVYQAQYPDQDQDQYTYLQMNVTNDESEGLQGDVAAAWYGDERVLEDDTMEAWVLVAGPYSYETVQGNERTIPGVELIDYELLDE